MAINLNDSNFIRNISKLSHTELVNVAQKLKYQNNKTIDRLIFKYSKQLKELNVDYIRDRITQDTSDEKLMMHIQDAYNNLTLGGGGKLGAKELKQIDKTNREYADIDDDLYDELYDHFLEEDTDTQINEIKSIIGSGEAYKEDIFKGSRIERTNKIMRYLERTGKIDLAFDLLI